jgi:Domain of unknown function (DUF4349)
MTDTEVLIRECLTTYADDAELVDLVPAAKAQGRQLSRHRESRYDVRRPAQRHGRMRLVVAGSCVGVVALVAAAFALGGTHAASNKSAHAQDTLTKQAISRTAPAGVPARAEPEHAHSEPAQVGEGQGDGSLTFGAKDAEPSLQSGTVASGTTASGGNGATSSGGDGVTATRVVKTGSLALTVPRGQVETTVSKLVALTTSLGGYVSQSRTDNVTGSPEGDLTLRMPAGKFDTAVSGAEKLGHETSLTTDAHDVTGKFVDLNARLTALQHTRSTYLTILGRATTIGSTLEVQDRVDGVQSQIEQLQGEIKVLRNQSADGTLTVSVSQPGTHHAPAKHHHAASGIGKAWHNSIHRFSRGFDAIVGALGVALLVLLVLAFLATVGVLGRRVVRAKAL